MEALSKSEIAQANIFLTFLIRLLILTAKGVFYIDFEISLLLVRPFVL